MNKSALIISAVFTAFALVVIGALAYASTVDARPPAVPVVENPAPAENTANIENTVGLDAQTQQAILDREAAYQQVIEQANQQLAQLQQQNQELQEQLQQAAAPAAAAPAQPAFVTPEEAAQIASKTFGQTQVFSVATVDWNGTTVYQVTFSSGDVATLGLDGQVLAMWQAPRANNVSGSSSNSGSSSGEDEHEYEYEHDDD